MNVIALTEEAFDELVKRLVIEVKNQLGAKPRDKWIETEEAMAMLKIKSKTTLQKIREEGKLRYTRPEPNSKSILYDADSIDEYLDKNAVNTFY